MSKSLKPEISFNDSIIAGEISSENRMPPDENNFSRMFRDIEKFHPYDYLNLLRL